MKNIVMLVDNKVRDLDVAALIAHHLRGMGINCHLEPLEAFRGALAAYRPEMVIFNHLTASHLVSWSKRLADMGVLTAVLPNEGILYDPHVLQYNAGRHHNGAHIDYFFCWNETHRQALLENGFLGRTNVETIGVPRFDFYFSPWSKIVRPQSMRRSERPCILFCTNFTLAKYNELPRAHADRLFAPWASRVPLYGNYRTAIEAHGRARTRVLDYLAALAAADEFEIILRPHPAEDASFYERWLESLPATERGQIRFDKSSSINGLILECDIEISCETCTTALESWIAGKPTIELVFERHPLWYREIQARGNVECDDPAALPGLVRQVLREPLPAEKALTRREHLATWCASPDGSSSLRLAQAIAGAVHSKKPADWSKLTVNDYRRAFKLKAARSLGLAYQFDPLMPMKRALFGRRYAIKDIAYRKSIKPRDVRATKEKIRCALFDADVSR